jgi:oligopeptidase A
VQAVLTHAENRDLRERVYWAWNTRASDQGPQAGTFDNSARITEILALRHEAAQMLGYSDAAALSLADKMAPGVAEVRAFLEDLLQRARPRALVEREELRAFAAAELGLPNLEAWDIAWASEKLRRARHALDEEEIKAYFPLPQVLAGLFELVERLFGVRVREHGAASVWHPDVRYAEVFDAAGQRIAGLYLDLYARGGKRGGAWMDVCRARFRDGARMQMPLAFLTCNFAPPTAQAPALLTHDDVLTLFHEMGHVLHHLLTEVDLPGVGGIDGVEWDAVELPSQFLENFAWRREGLDRVARHHRSGAALPEALFQRMLAARHFQAGLHLLRQLEFALYDLRLHAEYGPAQGARTLELLGEVRRAAAVLPPPAWQRFPHAFTHIFSGGYAAGYYGYLWAEVLAADAFARFEEEGVFNAATGAAFRREILAVGASRPALESFRAFRGRDPDPAPLLRSYGLTA